MQVPFGFAQTGDESPVYRYARDESPAYRPNDFFSKL
jgi:hypothetical protein